MQGSRSENLYPVLKQKTEALGHRQKLAPGRKLPPIAKNKCVTAL